MRNSSLSNSCPLTARNAGSSQQLPGAGPRLVPLWLLCVSCVIAAGLVGVLRAWADMPAAVEAAASRESARSSSEALAVEPSRIELHDLFAGRQLLVTSYGSDATRAARYASADPRVAEVDAAGYVSARGSGETEISVRVGEAECTVRVVVSAAGERGVDFANEIVPIFSRYGCNSGGCHGKASGQNGFRLSLFGFDAGFDYQALVQQARGRRVFPAAAERSLLLLKATGQVPHGGGKRLEPESEAYRQLVRWIREGLPAARPDAPRLQGVEVLPAQAVLQPGKTQQLCVLAHYSDGSVRDVTRRCEYASNLDVVASIDAEGLVAAAGKVGEAAIMARYLGQVAVCRVLVPRSAPLAEIAGFEPANYVDWLCAEKWKKLGLLPSPPCDDAAFLRRVTLDLCGRLPTVEEARAFLSLTDRDKRVQAVERLLASEDHAAFMAMRWGTILRNSHLAGSERAAYAFHNWLKDLFARNRPYDELVRGVVAAAGEWQDAPAINWYWQMRDDQLHQVTADTAQVFLGVRLACARCHHHPYERWSQEDYFGLAGFFTRLGRKSFGEPPPYFAAPQPTTGEVNPLTGRTPQPKFLNGEYVECGPDEDPRQLLVDWMVRPDNPYFAKVLVNRLWGHFFGQGLVNEVDDMRETNPPSNPELLDALAQDFISHGFDLRHIIRMIVNSRVYQLSSEPTSANAEDRQNFARFYARRLIAEVLLDAVDAATGSKTRFPNTSSRSRAIDLPHEGFGSYFLDAFDRPRRVTGCECERSSAATLAQVLLLANSDEIENKLADGQGRVARAVASGASDEAIIEELYLATLSRFPSEAERAQALGYVAGQADAGPAARQEALQDVLWALLNSKEFLFNH